MGLEALHRVVGEGEGAAEPVSQLVQDGAGQQRDIAGPLPQGRDVQGKGVEAVVQILPELPLRHIVGQGGVAGGDHPHVGLQLLDRAHRAEPPLLEDAQQLGLEPDVHFGDLVQKEGAAGGGLEEAHLAAPLGAGEGALGIAEELRLQHVGVEVGAVDGHKHPGGAGAGVVDGLGVELLARAALRLQQHRGVCGGNALGQLLHLHGLRADGHNVVKGVPGAVGPVEAAEHLLAPGLRRLQLLLGLVGVLQEGHHRHAALQLPVLVDGVHVDEVEVLDLLAGDVEDGLARLQHPRQPGAGAQLPELAALDGADVPSGLLVEELPVGPVAEDDAPLGVDDGNALPHGVKYRPGVITQVHGVSPFSPLAAMPAGQSQKP